MSVICRLPEGIWVASKAFQRDLKGIWVASKGFQPRPEDALVLLEGIQLDLEELWVYMEGFEQGLERVERESTRHRYMTQGVRLSPIGIWKGGDHRVAIESQKRVS